MRQTKLKLNKENCILCCKDNSEVKLRLSEVNVHLIPYLFPGVNAKSEVNLRYRLQMSLVF